MSIYKCQIILEEEAQTCAPVHTKSERRGGDAPLITNPKQLGLIEEAAENALRIILIFFLIDLQHVIFSTL